MNFWNFIILIGPYIAIIATAIIIFSIIHLIIKLTKKDKEDKITIHTKDNKITIPYVKYYDDLKILDENYLSDIESNDYFMPKEIEYKNKLYRINHNEINTHCECTDIEYITIDKYKLLVNRICLHNKYNNKQLFKDENWRE